MKIEKVKIGTVKGNKDNPRIIKDAKYAKLVESIKTFPRMLEIRPIVVDSEMIVLGGNMRLKACKEAGLKEVYIIKADDLTEDQKREFIVKDNVGFGEWDWEMLGNEWDMEELEDWGLDIPEMFADEPEETEGDDEVPEIPEEPETVLGDLWELGEHRLMCGDSTSVDDAGKLMAEKLADLVFTDPPYGVSYTNNMNDNHDVIMNDDVLLDFKPVLLAYSKKDTHWYIWTSDPVYDKWREMYADEFKSTIIWYKGGGGIGDLLGDYARNYELCLFCQNGRRELNGKRDGGVWEIGKDNGSDYLHPTQKPADLSAFGIEKSSNKGDIVLDLFGGSGSTLIGCLKTNRVSRLMELDPKYCDVIVKRYIKFCKENNREWSVSLNGESYKGKLIEVTDG